MNDVRKIQDVIRGTSQRRRKGNHHIAKRQETKTDQNNDYEADHQINGKIANNQL